MERIKLNSCHFVHYIRIKLPNGDFFRHNNIQGDHFQ